MSVSEEKNALRKIFRAKRKEIKSREVAERAIFEKVLSSKEYLFCNALFTYVSVNTEVDTIKLIKTSLEKGKRVAVPICNNTDFSMEFYYIESLDDLTAISAFGIPEADSKCKKSKADETTLCIIPAMSFDKNGFRLGYGKGFYDRYLKDFPGKTIGLCFDECLCESLPKSSDDMKASKVITQNQVILTDKGE